MRIQSPAAVMDRLSWHFERGHGATTLATVQKHQHTATTNAHLVSLVALVENIFPALHVRGYLYGGAGKHYLPLRFSWPGIRMIDRSRRSILLSNQLPLVHGMDAASFAEGCPLFPVELFEVKQDSIELFVPALDDPRVEYPVGFADGFQTERRLM